MSNSSTKITKIIILDDHPLLRQGIRQVIESQADIKVIAEASGANEAIDMINRELPDVAIVDITLSGSVNGIDFIKSIKERFPSVRSLVVSMHSETIYGERAIQAGAMGYIMKESASRQIISAIRCILDGRVYISEKLEKKMKQNLLYGNEKTSSNPEHLTNRELEIFQFIGNGFSTREISEKLNISINTIESHRKNIKRKLNLEKSSDMVKHAVQWVIMHKNG